MIFCQATKKTGLCNYPVSRDEQMALVTEKEKATAEMKTQKDANCSTDLRNKIVHKH